MAELSKLLSFMSSWDRQAVLADYAKKFEYCTDFDALVEQIGTPTKVAVELAKDYVPTPPPAVVAPAAAPEPSPEAIPAPEPEPEPEPEEGPQVRGKAPVLGVIAAVILGLGVALPVTIVTLVLGIPFLAAGVAVIYGCVSFVLHALPQLGLISDILLLIGGGLVGTAVGLLVAAFGLWLSLALSRLWVEKVTVPVGRALTHAKEVPEP